VVYGTTFPLPVVVLVRDIFGLPVANAFVDFGTANGELRRVTDALGMASVLYALPNDPVGYPPNTTIPIDVRLSGTSVTVTFTFTPVFPNAGVPGGLLVAPMQGVPLPAPPIPGRWPDR